MEPDGEFVLPVGTVTLLLADVEGSTRRWEEDRVSMATASSELRDLADELIGRHNGVRPLDQGEGDSFVGAFARPSEAVACALDIQQKASLPLRIGIHVGEVQRTEEGNYIGPALNRTARVRDSGHGGQVLLSQAAAELVADRLKDASLRDLGTYRLKDLSRPERIFQLLHPDLRSEFPPLRSLDLYRHNLPIHPTRFVGRQSEMHEIEDLLSDSSMVTLSGTGGSGKTRLALQIAAKLVDEFADGVFLCDLARVTDPQGVPAAVATAVGFAVEAGPALISLLSEKQLFLILDNCEHLISSSAELCQSLLAGAPNVQILATSREPLKVEGETNFVVPSLPVPPEDAIGGIEGLAPYAASELFLDRARRARSDFQLDDQDASAVAAICRRLDGIPLAIELAAARVRVMSPREIAQGLDERFGLLTGGARTAVPRHQTLTASVDWSHDLLTDLERAVLRRLSVFIGGFTLEAAKEVCSGPKDPDVAPHQAVDLLSLLVDKSLVNVSMTGGQSRYILLETIRQYAAAKLSEAAEEEDVRRAHRDHFLQSAVGLSELAEGSEGEEAFAAFVRDRENFEAAFRWSCAGGHFEEAARFLSASGDLLLAIWWGEAISWARAVMPSIDKVPEPTRTDVLYRCAPLLANSGPQAHLEPLLKECIEFHRKSGDELRLGRALLTWVQLALTKDEMTGVLEEAVEIAGRLNDLHMTLTAKAHSVFRLGIEDQDLKDRYLDDLVRELNEADAPVVRFWPGASVLEKLLLEDIVRSIAF
ncbi:MAG TPA: LuxR family transcriptional regulator, partial [Actinomycetota bacterium]|nr:LuxR family transcriptional regulator [Actinomycetota bacterium]